MSETTRHTDGGGERKLWQGARQRQLGNGAPVSSSGMLRTVMSCGRSFSEEPGEGGGPEWRFQETPRVN